MKSLKIGLIIVALCFALPAIAEDTVVLPKGRSSISLTYFSDTFSREFDNSGNDRELGYFLNNINITPIANAKLLELTGPLPFDILSSARTRLDCRVDVYGTALSWQYGLTEKLSVGVALPYFIEARSRVSFGLDLVFTPDAQVADIDRAILGSGVTIHNS